MNNEWISISKAAKELGMTINGIRMLIERGDLEGRQVPKPVRLCREVTRVTLECYKNLVANGDRRDAKSRKTSEGTGHRVKSKGYILIHKPKHPRAMCDGYVYEQWLVMEAFLGRHLTREETVHHKNRVRDDNRIENLHLYASRSEHMREAHGEMREYLKALHRLP